MMRGELQAAFEDCLATRNRGESIEQALTRHAEYADEIEPLLLLAERTQRASADQPSRAAFLASRTDMLKRANQLHSSPNTSLGTTWLRGSLAAVILALFIFITGGFGLAAASAQSLPGDELYPVKRSAERIRLNLTAGQRNRLNLTISQETRRVEEVRQLLNLGREVEVEFEAELSEQRGARWQFGEIPVLISAEIRVPSGFRVGDILIVRGRTTSQGWVRAHSLSAAGLTFDGRIEMMKSGQWIIDGRSLVILPSSRLGADLALGDLVRVQARSEGEFLVAQRIIAIDPAATPIPTIVPSDLETDDEKPTVTPEATPEGEQDESDLDDEASDDKDDTIDTPDPDEDEDEEDVEDDGEDETSNGSLTATPATEEPDDESDDPEEDETEEPEEHSQEIEYEGIIQSMEGEVWVIGGRIFIVDSETQLEGDPQLGDEVEIRAEQFQNGTLHAMRIEFVD